MQVSKIPPIRPSKTGNAGPKLHCLVWEKSGFSALLCELYFLAENKSHDGDIWAKIKLFLAYCLYIRPIFKERQQKYCFTLADAQIHGNFETRMFRIDWFIQIVPVKYKRTVDGFT